TLLLKDTASRTAFPTFDPVAFGQITETNPSLASFANASDVLMRADPPTFHVLPWAPNIAWIQCQTHDRHGNLSPFDTRGQLQTALRKLASFGYGMRCGLEVEFHVYKLDDPKLAPEESSWPAPAPRVSMIHPGNNVLCEQWADMSDEPLRIILKTAQSLGLPIRSLEIELGPSQVECVFDVQDALAAADSMALFRNATKQALRRAGYHATFMCRPQFPNIVSSGWHLHQSLYDQKSGANAFSIPTSPSMGDGRVVTNEDHFRARASNVLSPVGAHWLAGLLAHAHASCAFAVPTINGYARYQPNMMAPQRAIWGVGSRGAALRVVASGHANDPATRIENRLGEPAANPYLYIASQIYAGLDGIERALKLPPADESPYAAGDGSDALPNSLASALAALNADPCLIDGFGADFVHYFTHIKQHEIARFEAAKAASQLDWEQREYFDLF
ncbi:MAG: glutamine synthetase, partial [Burkholderiales bacterium]